MSAGPPRVARTQDAQVSFGRATLETSIAFCFVQLSIFSLIIFITIPFHNHAFISSTFINQLSNDVFIPGG